MTGKVGHLDLASRLLDADREVRNDFLDDSGSQGNPGEGLRPSSSPGSN